MNDIITAKALKVKICEALGLDPGRVSRIVIDIDARDELLRVDVEIYGDTRLLDIEWEPGVMKVEIDES